MTAERWLPAPGYEGLYEVSDLGRVRGLNRLGKIRDHKRARGHERWLRAQMMTPTLATGYPVVKLTRNGSHRGVYVHELVLLAFVGARPPGHRAVHGPGGKQDASLANLAWGPRSDTWADALRRRGAQALRRRPLTVASPAPDADHWRDSAACRGNDTAAWFDRTRRAEAAAVAVCKQCPVRAQCLDYGKAEQWGVWGGVPRWGRVPRRKAA